MLVAILDRGLSHALSSSSLPSSHVQILLVSPSPVLAYIQHIALLESPTLYLSVPAIFSTLRLEVSSESVALNLYRI